MDYQVIARKYRPQTLAQVACQDATVTTLKNALKRGKVAHAYLFCGSRGTGKTTLARLFAKALNCLSPIDSEPCNQCACCTEINNGSSLDVLEIDGASNRGIDDIRQINDTVGYAPSSCRYKIYIVDEVHMLTKEAFNALLKTLEEPPPHVKFFFATTEPHKILPTILSRCQRFDLNRIPVQGIVGKLKQITADLQIEAEEDALSMIASLAEGSLRDAESLLDQVLCSIESPITLAKTSQTLGLVSRSCLFALDEAFDAYKPSFAFELAADIFDAGKEFSYFLSLLLEHYRLHLKLKLDPSLAFPALKQQYLATNSFYNEEQCLHILDFLIQAEQSASRTPFKRVHLEMILLHIIRSKYRLSLPALVKRLEELEKKTPADKKTLPPPETKTFEQKMALETSPELKAPLPPPESKTTSPVFEQKMAPEPTPEIKAPLPPPEEGDNKPFIKQKLPQQTDAKKPANCDYDTLIRFAAVELEGVLHRT
ncbi:MAG: polymerase subunit gamma/tau [Chlamydiota bacterium]|jgi:DNA polymerase-3 subunit gamma/tau